MPRATPVYRNQAGERFTIDPETRDWRPMVDDDYGRMAPVRALDQMGVDWDERFILKNFAANPGTALSFLRGLKNDDGSTKYEAFQYGDGLNFAVRRLGPDGQALEKDFKVVDQNKGGIGEFFRDIADLLIGDIALPTIGAIGGAFAGSAVAPVAGTIAGVGAGSAAAEGVRQGIGSAAGIPDNFDPVQTAIFGATGAVTQGALAGSGALIGRFVSGAAKKVASGLAPETLEGRGGVISRSAGEFAKRIMGITEGDRLTIGEIIRETHNRFGRPAITPDRAINIVQQHTAKVARPWISRLTEQRNAAIPKTGKGSTVNLHEYKDALVDLSDIATNERTFRWGSSAVDQDLKEAAIELLEIPSRDVIQAALGRTNPGASIETINAALKAAQEAWEQKLRRVPTRLALSLKNRFQMEASMGGGFPGQGAQVPGAASVATKRFTNNLASFSRELNISIKNQIPKRVGDIDRELSAKIIAREKLLLFMGADAANPEASFSRALVKTGSPVRDALRAYDAAFQGSGFMRLARDVAIGSKFTPIVATEGAQGLPGAVPKIAARAGLPIGFSAIGGGVLGFAAGGLPGALIGGAAGIAAASPANIVRFGPGIARGAAAVGRGAGALSQARSTATGRILRRGAAIPFATMRSGQIYGKHVADEDKKKKRKAYFTAQ